MVRRQGVEGSPREQVEGDWPDVALGSDAPPEVAVAQHISLTLRDAVREANVSDVADRARIHRSTIYAIISGTTWPDVVSLARLEWALDVELWP